MDHLEVVLCGGDSGGGRVGGPDVLVESSKNVLSPRRHLTRRRRLLDCRTLMKFFRLVPVLLLGICPGPRLHAEMVDGILAVINDTVITRQQVEDYAAPAIESLRRQYATDPQ